MTPKEKAKELVDKFMTFGAAYFVAKECALICVKEKFETLKGLYWMEQQNLDREYQYLEDVSNEIIKL